MKSMIRMLFSDVHVRLVSKFDTRISDKNLAVKLSGLAEGTTLSFNYDLEASGRSLPGSIWDCLWATHFTILA